MLTNALVRQAGLRTQPKTHNVLLNSRPGPLAMPRWGQQARSFRMYSTRIKPAMRRELHHPEALATPLYTDSSARPLVLRQVTLAPSTVQRRGYVDSARSEEPGTEQDFIIDPITNRKVPRVTFGTFEVPTEPTNSTTSANYGTDPSLFPTSTDSDPHYSDGPPPRDELSKYKSIPIDSAEPADFSEPGPTLYSYDSTHNRYEYAPDKTEEYSLNQLPAEEEEFPLQEGELNKYQAVVDEIQGVEAAESAIPAEELGKYAPFYASEQDAVSVEKEPLYEDLNHYQPYMHQESQQAIDEVDTPDAEDLAQYKPKVFDDFPDTAATAEEPFQQYGDLDKYKAFRDQALETESEAPKDEVDECLQEYDLKQEDNVVEAGDGVDLAYETSDLGVEQNEPVCVFDSTLHGVPAETPKGTAVSPDDFELPVQTHPELSDAADRSTRAQLPPAPARGDDMGASPTQTHSITGNYVRDFPEDFSKSWSDVVPPPQVSHPVREDPAVQAEEKAFAEQLDAASTMPIYEYNSDHEQQNTHRLESSLDRYEASKPRPQIQPKEPDIFSAEPQGLETSYLEECRSQPKGRPFVRTYGTQREQNDHEPSPVAEPPSSAQDHGTAYHRDPEVDGQGFVEPNAESPAKPAAEPIVYRVLAYDPITQNISIAETTSDVADQSASSAPADILLRLTHPTKFFPYFAPLQAEGFEIVSGGGDMLVFRKARASMRRVNPIDLMGTPMALPNAAAFASPTGFVNYDIPRVDETMDGEQENRGSSKSAAADEATTSGPQNTQGYGRPQRKKRSWSRKVLIAGTSLVGVTYAAGVVAEYFAAAKPRPGRF